MSQMGSFAPSDLVFEIPTVGKLLFRVKDGLPVKLGDGTFGIVYEVFDPETDTPYAVKLLYDNYATRPRDLSRIDDTYFEKAYNAAMAELKLESALTATVDQAVKQGTRSTADIIARLQAAGVSDWKRFIDTLQKHASSTAVERFIGEMKVSQKIKRSLQRRGQLGNKAEGTVEIIGGTETFQTSDAYIALSAGGYFDDQRTRVSNYALVMELYRFTLKDLLEKGPHRELYRIKLATLFEVFASEVPPPLKEDVPTLKELFQRIEAVPLSKLPGDDDTERLQVRQRLCNDYESLFGYGLLRSMSIRDRVRTALPYLEGITKGLLNLHNVDKDNENGPLFHHDIKPANIFVNADISFNCALGDLGFVGPEAPATVQTYAPLHDELPLGSLHYRSPEQKEFFDVAMVEVRHEEQQLTLIVRDPKFRWSFIDTGDSVVFSKDRERNQHQILEIKRDSSSLRLKIAASLSVAHHEDHTQVVFYKQHGHRTDLFGVGAILYDMITCGESPERFYDNIRRFEYSDDPNHRGQAGSVEALLDKYSRVSQGRAYADDPSLVQIFEPFRHESEGYYADREVVALILKCMLYKAQGTFYNEAKSPEDAARNLLTAIRQLMQSADYNLTPADFYANPLVTLKVEPRPGVGVNPFPGRVLELQQQHIALRIAQGVYYFERLITPLIFARRPSDDGQAKNDTPYLYELLPNRIQQNVERNGRLTLALGNPTYNTEEDFIAELRADRIVKLNRDASDPYVPDYLAFMRREVQLFYKGHESGSYGTKLQADYRFLDASPFGDQVTVGDKLVLILPNSRRHLGSITGIDRARYQLSATFASLTAGMTDLDLSRQRPGELLKATDTSRVGVAYYAQLQPARYYLDMLALYLHQLFFAYSPLTGESRDKIDLRLLREGKPGFMAIAKPAPPRVIIGPRPKAPVLEQIHRLLAHMYLCLTFHESPNSYYFGYDERSPESWRKVIERVAADADQLRTALGEALVGDKQAFKFELPTSELKLTPSVSAELRADNARRSSGAAQETLEPLIDLRKLMRELLAK